MVSAILPELQFVDNEEKYFDFIRVLRNTLRSSFLEQAIITPDEQVAYMHRYKLHYYIALYRSMPAGFIGIINNDLRLAVQPEYQRLGIASFMLSEIRKKNIPFTVRVKASNHASQCFFEKNGFSREGVVRHDGVDVNILRAL
jgi:GNAT superfamily N-acetyltransferase